MSNISTVITPATATYLIGLLYRNTRTSCVSLALLCARVSHDTLRRVLYQKVPWSRRLWDTFAQGLVQKGGYRVGTPDDLPPKRRDKYEQSGRRSLVLTKKL